jgi:Zn-dependent peptidase ImmA (M78 family)
MYNVMYTKEHYMSQMVRKQIYIYKRQEAQLKRIAEAQGVSEAEIIRRALEQTLSSGTEKSSLFEKSPLDEFIELARSNKKDTGRPFKWNRQDAYEEREKRLMARLSNHDKADSD